MAGIIDTNLVVQIAIIVKDIEATRMKFAEFLGVAPPKVISGGDFTLTNTHYMGIPAPNVNAKLAFFNIGSSLTLELIEPNGEKSALQDHLDERGEGLHHIAFRVKGIDEKIAACEEFGMTCVQRGNLFDIDGEYAYMDATKDLKCFIDLLENHE